MQGLKLAALYGIYPHKLGFCGPQEKSATKALLNYLSGKKISEKKIRKILEEFKGAFSYYKLIAKSNDIKDPFNEKVVKAYWIGNDLLEKVKTSDLKKMIAKDFSGLGLLKKGEIKEKLKKVSSISKPHHSFHVLIMGSVTGRIVLKEGLIGFCLINWAKVKKIKNKRIVIEYRLLVKNKKFQFGKLIEKEIILEKSFIPKVKIGDWVALHWNHPIQILSKKEVSNLKKYTQITINSLNEK